MDFKKPLTENMRKKARAVVDYLKANERFVEKEELQAVIGCTNERTVRDVIAYVAMYYPIIANSAQSGYKLARKMSDVEAVRHTWAELSSRQNELERRMQPLIRFCEKASSTRHSVFIARAPAIATRCFCPPDRR